MADQNTENAKDHADIVMRPPFIYLIALGCGIGLNYLWQLAISSADLMAYLPFLFVIPGLYFMIFSMRFFIKNNQHPDPLAPTNAIYQDGVYGFSRNPMYVGVTLVYLALSLWFNNAWMLITLIPALITMHYGVVLREEIYLEEKFGQEYLDYKTKVRRWF